MQTKVVNRIPEWRYQAEVIARLNKLADDGLPIAYAGDMGAGRRSRAEQMLAKTTGLVAGEPDIRVYLQGGRSLLLELKTPTGSRSKAQKDRHELLTGLGFEVLTLKAQTPEALADLAEQHVRARL